MYPDYTYSIKITSPGAYQLTKVTDVTNKEGCVSGTGTLVNYTPPTAALSGTQDICSGTSTTFDVQLTGTAPWQFSYSKNGDSTGFINNIIE